MRRLRYSLRTIITRKRWTSSTRCAARRRASGKRSWATSRAGRRRIEVRVRPFSAWPFVTEVASRAQRRPSGRRRRRYASTSASTRSARTGTSSSATTCRRVRSCRRRGFSRHCSCITSCMGARRSRWVFPVRGPLSSPLLAPLMPCVLRPSSATEQQQTVLAKQEAVFERLTHFAVWVQDCTKVCDSVALDARAGRDAARRHLVALWVREDSESERYSLGAPSESSHVFHPV